MVIPKKELLFFCFSRITPSQWAEVQRKQHLDCVLLFVTGGCWDRKSIFLFITCIFTAESMQPDDTNASKSSNAFKIGNKNVKCFKIWVIRLRKNDSLQKKKKKNKWTQKRWQSGEKQNHILYSEYGHFCLRSKNIDQQAGWRRQRQTEREIVQAKKINFTLLGVEASGTLLVFCSNSGW